MAPDGKIELSVVIPLYNKRAFIRSTIESVLSQGHAASEVIVVDDGSSDGSSNEIADLESCNFRIVRQVNAGPGAARNHGIRLARSPWVALVDGDDLWMPDHLATLAGLIQQFPAADFVASGFRRSPNRPSFDDWRPPTTPNSGRLIDYLKEAAKGEVVCSSSIALRRTSFMQSTGFGGSMQGEDTEFWARMALDHRFAVTPHVTAIYIVSTGGQMDIARRDAKLLAKKKLPPVFDTIEKALANPRYAPRHGDIRFYRDKLFEQRAKNALYGGHPDEARRNLASCPRPWSRKLYAYRALAWLPGPLLRIGSQTYSRLKARQAGSMS